MHIVTHSLTHAHASSVGTIFGANELVKKQQQEQQKCPGSKKNLEENTADSQGAQLFFLFLKFQRFSTFFQ